MGLLGEPVGLVGGLLGHVGGLVGFVGVVWALWQSPVGHVGCHVV